MQNAKKEKNNGPCFIFNIGEWQIGDSNRKDDCSKDMLFNNEELIHFRSAQEKIIIRLKSCIFDL